MSFEDYVSNPYALDGMIKNRSEIISLKKYYSTSDYPYNV